MSEHRHFVSRLLEGFKRTGPGAFGALIGFLLGLLLFTFGLWKTVAILCLTLGGYYVSIRYFSNPDDFKNLLDKLFPPGLFR